MHYYKAKILLVANFPEFGDDLFLHLEMKGYEVIQVHSKTLLLSEMSHCYYPDLILLNNLLGNENGKDLCCEIKDFNHGILVFIFSANGELSQEYEDSGADEIIAKPFDMSNLVQRIDSYLR